MPLNRQQKEWLDGIASDAMDRLWDSLKHERLTDEEAEYLQRRLVKEATS